MGLSFGSRIGRRESLVRRRIHPQLLLCEHSSVPYRTYELGHVCRIGRTVVDSPMSHSRTLNALLASFPPSLTSFSERRWILLKLREARSWSLLFCG